MLLHGPTTVVLALDSKFGFSLPNAADDTIMAQSPYCGVLYRIVLLCLSTQCVLPSLILF